MQELLHAFLSEDIGLPMFSSLVTGILIGLEREMRAKPAGLRTHALVCFAATLVMLAAVRQADWVVEFIPGTSIVADPTRMAHGVLTGIGFLCAGVIFREGPSVHGLTTAASLWMTSSIGLLYGVGLYWLAVSGTVLTLGVLILLRGLLAVLPSRVEVRLRVAADAASGFDPDALRELLSSAGLAQGSVSQSLDSTAGRLEMTTRTWIRGSDEGDALARALAAASGVQAFAIAPVDEEAAVSNNWRQN
jgi:putative Mg2+ transporter-C (MgtC) family protein